MVSKNREHVTNDPLSILFVYYHALLVLLLAWVYKKRQKMQKNHFNSTCCAFENKFIFFSILLLHSFYHTRVITPKNGIFLFEAISCDIDIIQTHNKKKNDEMDALFIVEIILSLIVFESVKVYMYVSVTRYFVCNTHRYSYTHLFLK